MACNDSAIFSIAYVVEFINGNYFPLFYFGFFIVGWVPLIIGFVLNKKRKTWCYKD